MKKYFNEIGDFEKGIIETMCEAIESRRVFVVASNKRWKMLCHSEGNAVHYVYDYTYNLIRWGFAKKARNTDFHAALHPYCPNQDISGTLSNFLNTAVEMGFYTRTTDKVFNGGTEFQTIWM